MAPGCLAADVLVVAFWGYGVSFSLVGFVVATGFLIAGLACKSAWAIVWCGLAGLSLADLRC